MSHHLPAFWAKRSFFGQNLDLGWKFPTLSLEERTEGSSKRSFLYIGLQMCVKRKEKKNQSIKDWRKAKENIKERKKRKKERFFGLDNVWTMCKISKKQKKKKKRMVTVAWFTTWGMCKAITCLVTKQIFVSDFVPRWTKEKRKQMGKSLNYQSLISRQESNFLKVLLIHDYACYLWFDGKWFTKSNNAISMVWN